MKNRNQNSARSFSTGLCLLFCLLAAQVRAAVDYWDPQGTTGANPVLTVLSAVWEGANWSTINTGVAVPASWVEGNAACFAINTGAGTPAFTVTMSASHTVAGFFNGPLHPNPCTVTVTGAGTLVMSSANLNGFDVTTDGALDPGLLTINNVISGPTTGGICAEGSGQVFLNGANTFLGGTYLGYSGASFTGIWNFNNSASFGPGSIYMLNCPGGALVAEGTTPITIPNTVTVIQSTAASLNIVGNPAGITFSGPWQLSGGNGAVGAPTYATNVPAPNALLTGYGPVTIGSGGATNDLVIISGIISGTNTFAKNNIGILQLTATNTLNNTVTASAGVLALGSTGSISNAASLTIQSNATFSTANPAGGGLCNNLTIQPGGIFDVSLNSSFVLGANVTLYASGNGTLLGNNAAAINGAVNGTVNLGVSPVNLVFAPTGLNGDSTHPSLYINQGTLDVNSNVFTVTNAAGAPLGAGIYVLIEQGIGTVSPFNGNPTVNVVGAGLSNGFSASLIVSNNTVSMVVANPTSVIWNGGDSLSSSNWSDVLNWVGSVPPISSGDNVIFGNTTGAPVSIMDSSYEVNALIFSNNANAYSLNNANGGILTVDSVTNGSANVQTLLLPIMLGDLGATGTSQWSVSNGNLISVSGPISDFGGGFALTGSGLLNVSGTNTFTGPISDGAGTIFTINGTGSLAHGTYTAPIANQGAFTYNSTTAQTLSGTISGAGALTVSSTGALTLSGANTYTGPTTNLLSTGAISISGSGSLGGGNYTTNIVNNGSFTYGSSAAQTLSGIISGNGTLTKSGSSTLTLTGTNTYTGNTTVSAGTLAITGNGLLANGAYSGTIANAGALAFNSSNSQTLSGAISGAGTLTQSGPGTLTLSAVNTYSGTTTINSNTLMITGTGTVGTNNIIDNGAFIFNSTSGENYTGAISGSGTVSSGGTLTLSGVNSYHGNTTITGGTLTMGKASIMPNGAGNGTVVDNGALNLGAFSETVNGISGSGTVTGATGSALILWPAFGTTNTLSGVISGSEAITVGSNGVGGGVEYFSGVNTFTNTVTVSVGQLWINNSSGLGASSPARTITISGNDPELHLQGTNSNISLVSGLGFSTANAIVNGAIVNEAGNNSIAGGITLTGATAINANAGTLTISGGIAGSGTLTLEGAGGGTVGGVISSSLSLVKSGTGAWTNSNVNTYTGTTTISGGTLSLGSSGALSNSTVLNIGAGGTLDVSGLAVFNLSSSTSLSASGTGTNTTAASINGNGSVAVNLGAQPINLSFAPVGFAGDQTHPALYIPNGVLTINSNQIVVTNTTGTPLGVGLYYLIQVGNGTSGTINGTPNPAVFVYGAGIAAGTVGVAQVSGSTVVLTVAQAGHATTTAVSTPTISYGTANNFFSAAVSPIPDGGEMQFFLNGAPIGGPVQVNTTTGIAVATTATSTTLAAGSYPVYALYTGSSDNNFAASTSATNTFVVTPAAVTITANAITNVYGSAVPGSGSSQFTRTAMQNADTIATVTLTVSSAGNGANAGTTNETVGTYTLTPSVASGTYTPANYNITYVTNTLTITPAALTITGTGSKSYGTALTSPSLATNQFFQAAGLVNGQTTASIVVTVSFSAGTNANSPAGTYASAITPTNATELAGSTNFPATNYNITYATGNLTINSLAASYSGTQLFNGGVYVEPNVLSVANHVGSDTVYPALGLAIMASPNVGTEGISSGAVGLANVGSQGTGVGSGTNAQFNLPTGVALDSSGNLYISDTGNNRVCEVTNGVSFVLPFTNLTSPAGIAVDTLGNVYVAEPGSNEVLKMPVGTSNQVVFASGLNYPLGVAVDKNNNVYVTDTLSNRILQYTGSATNTLTGFNGFLSLPAAVAVDTNLDVFVNNAGSNTIVVLSNSVTPLFRIVLTNGNGATNLNFAAGLAVDKFTNLYVANFGNTGITKVSNSLTLASLTNTIAFASPNSLLYPAGVAVDAAGDLFVTDSAHNRIVEDSVSSVFSVLLGSTQPVVPNYITGGTSSVVVSQVPPTIIGVTNATMVYGTPTVTLTGTVIGPGPLFPPLPSGTAVSVTINGNTESTTVSGSSGGFSMVYLMTNLPASGTNPYTISYSSAATANFTAASNTNTTLTVQQATAIFTNLSGSQTNIYGTTAITLSGQIIGTNPLATNLTYPALGETFPVEINGNTNIITIGDNTGDFTRIYTFIPNTIPAGSLPIVYYYHGDNNFIGQTNVGTSLTITPLPVVLFGIRPYDGTTNAYATNLIVSNKIAGDQVFESSGIGGLSGTFVGVQTITSIGTLTLGGSNGGNYANVASGTMIITNAVLTYTATPTNQLYGSTNTNFTGTVTGFAVGDSLGTVTTGTAIFTSTTTSNSLPGSYPIIGSGLTLTNSTNYIFVQAAGNATALTISLFQTLHSFSGSDGAMPEGGLALSGITLYGTTEDGGTGEEGSIFAVNTNGTGFRSVFSFTNGPDGGDPFASLVMSGSNVFGTAQVFGNGGNGTVFTVSTNGTSYSTLHGFVETDGSTPTSGLVQSGSTLFGTAIFGGSSDYGTIFSVGTNGTGFVNMHSFVEATDGAYPQAGLIMAGNQLYGTASTGGASGYGTVFAINTNGTGFTNLHSFTAGNGGAYPFGGLVLSTSGVLYGTTSAGGSGGSGTVFMVATNGTGFSTLHAFTNLVAGINNEGAFPQAGLVLSEGTNLYGTANAGGTGSNGSIFMLHTDGTGFANLHNFSPTEGEVNGDGANPYAGLILSGGFLYGTAWAGGASGDGTVFSLFVGQNGTTNAVSGSSTLSLVSIGNQTIGFWPSSSANSVLQASSGSSGNWVTVSGAPIVGLSVSANAPNTYFRLENCSSPSISLSSASAGQQVLIYWSASETSAVLQSTTDLSSGNWVNVSGGTSVVGLTLPAASSNTSYRLEPQ